MSEFDYSLHLGSDKNRKNISKQNSKNNLSGTTSLPNNAIQNVRQLSKVDKHNYRKYDNEQELLEIVRGTSSPLDDVKELYLSEFEEARLKYNSKQSRPSRMIDNYFDNVSNNAKKDLACEIILELGDKEYWDTKNGDFKKKMSEVYKKQVDDLEMLVPNFKVASAIIHYDETSPHLHIVGVPIKYKNKNGMEKQVGKSDVFTKESLIRLQDKMRTLCIEEFNQVYNLDSNLKKKQIEKNTENLKQTSKKSNELKNNSKNIKDKIDKLKVSKLNKDNYILSKEDKNSFIDFINQVNDTSKEYDKIQTLSNTLVNAHEQLKDKNNKIKTLTENNEALNLRVKTLNDTIKEKDNEISFLKSKISDLKNTLVYWKDKFEKLISFLHDKLHSWYDKDDKYIDIVNDMYDDNVLDDDDIEDLDLSKEKEDYER